MLLKGNVTMTQNGGQRPVMRDRRWVVPQTGSFLGGLFVPRLLHRKELKRGICILVAQMKQSGMKRSPIELGTGIGWLQSAQLSNKGLRSIDEACSI
jgi:hypothetical protein